MLTDKQCQAAKKERKAYKLFAGGGLQLHVSETGYKSWRLKYRFGGKERLLTYSKGYPEMSLADARARRDADKLLLKRGKDPKVESTRVAIAARLAATETFELLAREWFEKQKSRWTRVHAEDVITSLERDVFCDLGSIPATQVDSILVLATLKKVEDRGAIETAHRLRQRICSIYEYGRSKKCVTHDPTADVAEAMKAKPKAKLWPAIVNIKGVRNILSVTDTACATPVVRLASRYLALTAQRPGMIRVAEWCEIEGFCPEDPDQDHEVTWIVPAAKLKQELQLREDQAFAHPVPLAQASVDVLRQAWRFSAGSPYVFPGGHSIQRPMSENALSYLLAREGFKGRHVPHGWRSSFSTIMNEWANDDGRPRDPLILDLMLGHAPEGLSSSELRYMRSAFQKRRRALAEIWADMLLEGALAASALTEGRRRRKF